MTLKAFAFALPIVFLSACATETDEPDKPPVPPVEECNVSSPETFLLMKGDTKILMNEGADLGEFDKRVLLGESGDSEFSFSTEDGAFTFGAMADKGEELSGDLQVKGEECGEDWDAIMVKNEASKVAAVNVHADKKTYDIEVVDQVTCIDFNWDHKDAAGNKKILWMIGVVNTTPDGPPESPWSKGVAMTQSEENPAIWEADIWAYNPWSETPNEHLEDYNFKVVYNAEGVWGESDGTYNVDWGNGPEPESAEEKEEIYATYAGKWYVKSFSIDGEGANEVIDSCTNAPLEENDEGEMLPNTGGCRVKYPGSAEKGLHLTFNVETQSFSFEMNK
ncbi:hypothetical protein PEPS_35240 (plasmid) [Persicobacter psychrovividus]|uniref:Lipoprotein n=2 Tax=Persicobacter psychrovividus TaxID=387638 RepID=A0ABM7VJS3_9BACT|nr:hypothetical protein PEPS_35240 [Persicobacter psychrovividus]